MRKAIEIHNALGRLLVLTASVITLSGCGATRSELDSAAVSLQGKTREKILECMGPPTSSATIGNTEVWKYAVEKYVASDGNLGKRSCELQVNFKDGVVSQADYRGSQHWVYRDFPMCDQLIRNCN